MKKVSLLILLTSLMLWPLMAQEKGGMTSKTQLALMQDSLTADSTNWQLMLRLADAYQEKNRTKRAQELYERAIQLHVSDTLQRALAKCYYSRGYYRKSIDLCNNLLQKDTIDEDLVLVARCYERMGDVDSTIAYRELIAERDIEDYGNVQSLARIYNQVGMNEMALYYLDLYYNVDSTNLTVNNLRAYILHELRQFDEEIEEYRKLREAGFRDATSLYYAGVANARIGRRKEAFELLDEARERSIIPNGYIYAELSMVCDIVGEYEDGIKHAETAIDLLLPDTSLMYSVYDQKAMNEVAKFKYRDAIESYKRSLDYQKNLTNICQLAYLYGALRDERNEQRYYELFLKELETVNRPERYASLKQRAERRLRRMKEEQFFRDGVPQQNN
ncbi:MAG: tetratricopeptide repeat protein [Bacteroidaceae bacterium]|nr:tetratricopeptide repeat protein [Bacteroidaceae bacterium]